MSSRPEFASIRTGKETPKEKCVLMEEVGALSFICLRCESQYASSLIISQIFLFSSPSNIDLEASFAWDFQNGSGLLEGSTSMEI